LPLRLFTNAANYAKIKTYDIPIKRIEGRNMSYPVKLRERAMEAVLNGHSRAEVNEMFGPGVNTLRDWEILKEETGSLENRALNRTAYKIDREKLLEYYRKNPFSTNKETAIAFECSVSGVRSAKKVLGITRKKTQFSIPNEMNRKEKNS
jgi:transposase